MQPALDSTTLDRLIALGRERGQLTTEDLRASLPVDNMSAADIALIVVHLEETGVPVELEDSLLSPHSEPSSQPRRSAEIIPFPGPRSDMKKPKARTLQSAKPVVPEPKSNAATSTPVAHWAVAAAGVAAFAVFSLIIYATAL